MFFQEKRCNFDRHNIGFAQDIIEKAKDAFIKRCHITVDLSELTQRRNSAGFLQGYALAEVLSRGYMKIINIPFSELQ